MVLTPSQGRGMPALPPLQGSAGLFGANCEAFAGTCRAWSRAGCRSLLVDAFFRQLRQFHVGRLLLIQRLLQKPGNVRAPDPLGKRPRGAIGGNLVVLHSLSSRDQGSVL